MSFKFKQGQRFRVIVSNACFYATAKEIRNGVGDFVQCNQAVREALRSLQDTRSLGGIMDCATGQSGTYEGMQVQLNMA